MLSRTASNLYWLFRYTERADFVARILDATMRLATLPTSYSGERNEWESALAVAGNTEIFHQHYDAVNEGHGSVISSPSRPAIHPPLEAHSNMPAPNCTCRAHGADGGDVGDDQRRLGFELKKSQGGGDVIGTPSRDFLVFAKKCGAAFRRFSLPHHASQRCLFISPRLGAADRARGQHCAYPRCEVPRIAARDGGGWAVRWTISSGPRSCARCRRIRLTIGSIAESVRPWHVADLLILNRQMPRSLACCYESLVRHLDLIARHLWTARTLAAPGIDHFVASWGLRVSKRCSVTACMNGSRNSLSRIIASAARSRNNI